MADIRIKDLDPQVTPLVTDAVPVDATVGGTRMMLVSAFIRPKVNEAGGAAPGVGNDSTEGYIVGSTWVYPGVGVYTALDVSVGAAVWEISGPVQSDADPEAVGTADPGVSLAVSRVDHVHAHGNQLGGALHADVDPGVASGFMTGAYATKLDGIATAATADAASDDAPQAVGAAAAGTGAAFSRYDHIHAHGNQAASATMHAAATTTTAGFVELATVTEAVTGTDTSRAVTPQGLAAAIATGVLTQKLTNVQAAGYTIAAVDIDGIIHATGAGAQAFALPDLSASLVAGHDIVLEIQQEGAATFVTVTPAAGSQINGAGSGVAFECGVGRQNIKLVSKDGLLWFASLQLSSENAAPIGVAAPGTSAAASRDDHVHAHGNLAGGALHADAVSNVSAGFMSGADKLKLDGIEALADVTDATNVAAALAGACAISLAAEEELALAVLSLNSLNVGGNDFVRINSRRQATTISGAAAFDATNDGPSGFDVLYYQRIVYATGAGAMAWTLGDCSTRVISGFELVLRVQQTGASTAITITLAGGATINGSGSAYVMATGYTFREFRSQDGVAWFTAP